MLSKIEHVLFVLTVLIQNSDEAEDENEDENEDETEAKNKSIII